MKHLHTKMYWKLKTEIIFVSLACHCRLVRKIILHETRCSLSLFTKHQTPGAAWFLLSIRLHQRTKMYLRRCCTVRWGQMLRKNSFFLTASFTEVESVQNISETSRWWWWDESVTETRKLIFLRLYGSLKESWNWKKILMAPAVHSKILKIL